MARVFTTTLFYIAAAVPMTPVAWAQTATVHKSPHKSLKRSCDRCHVPTSFHDIRFEHAQTGFRLTGFHAGVTCLACHNVEDFSMVESSCATCHRDIHRARLGVDCARCHTEDGWTVFDPQGIHENTSFPIQGKHLLIDCVSCHPGMPAADFRRVWTRCYDCHRQEYEATTNPAHAAGGFPVLCQNCHEMTGWTPAAMPDHDPFFPIYSGTHNRRWDSCSNCHVVPGNYRAFECITCHAHNQPDMDSHHQGIPGYVYSSPACYQCHPTGEAGDFGEHDTAFFPIFSGSHRNQWDHCSICHPDAQSRAVFTCISCHDHDRAPMDDKHAGEVRDYVYTATSCYDCHPNGRGEESR
jgi:hypothetical protein